MKRTAALALVVLAMLLPQGAAAQQAQRRPAPRKPATPRHVANEPFSTFQQMDKLLEIVNARAASLEHSRPEAIGVQARQLRAAANKLEQLSNRLRQRYRARRFGSRLFADLSSKAAALAKAAGAMASAKNDAAREAARQKLSRATLALVLQYQGAASNYGALRCDRGQWACCEPRAPAPNTPRVNACTWVCAANRGRCRGFLGPQTSGPAATRSR